MKCSYCNSDDLRWSNFRFWELPLRMLGFRACLCRCCRRRDFLSPSGWRLSLRILSFLFTKWDYEMHAPPEKPVGTASNKVYERHLSRWEGFTGEYRHLRNLQGF
jgi:hypothetical protein